MKYSKTQGFFLLFFIVVIFDIKAAIYCIPEKTDIYTGIEISTTAEISPIVVGSNVNQHNIFTKPGTMMHAWNDTIVTRNRTGKKILSDIKLLSTDSNSFWRNVDFNLEAQGTYTSNHQVPFWLRANQFGSLPLSGPSFSILGGIYKHYERNRNKKLDWGMGISGRGNFGNSVNGILVEAYAKLKWQFFELKVGRSKDIVGLIADSTLSSGSFSISGNALGIPKIQLSVSEFRNIPFTKGILSFKGNFAHGWLGETILRDPHAKVPEVKSYFHQFSLYGRFGKPSWRLKLYAGFNHEAFWGNEHEISPSYHLTQLQAFISVATGKVYNSSKVGNHLGSLDLGFEYEFNNFKIIGTRQNFYDVGALAHLANLRDGLNGISFVNLRKSERNISFRKVLLELLYTKNQAGELWSKYTPSGDEDYYHNSTYYQGWSYQNLNLGTPFITPKNIARTNLAGRKEEFFINNRVIAYNIGIVTDILKWTITTKISYSRNFGTYGNSPIGNSTGRLRYISPPPYFQQVGQFSGYLKIEKKLRYYNYGCTMAMDIGNLLYNSYGINVFISKIF